MSNYNTFDCHTLINHASPNLNPISSNPPPPEETALVTKTNDVVIEVLDNVTDESEILTNNYILNAGIVLSTNAVQASINRYINNNDLFSKDEDGSLTLTMDMAFAHFNNKMVKGNWTEVDSVAIQFFVLLSYVASAAACDVASAALIPNQNPSNPLIGKTTALALVNSLCYISAMNIAAILNKKTYTKGEITTQANSNAPQNRLVRKAASGALVAGTAMAAATANRLLINSESSFGIVLNMVSNEIVNKLFKTGQGTEKETAKKVELLAFYCFMSIAADVLAGAIIPGSDAPNGSWRYIGTTSIGAVLSFSKVSAKALLDHKPKEAEGEKKPLLPADKKKTKKKPSAPSAFRNAVALAVTVATPILTIAANHIPFISQAPALSFGVKLVQHNVNGLAVRELYKNANTTFQCVAISLMPAVLAFGCEFMANRMDPNASFLLPVTGVAIATGASYLGMTLSGKLLKGDGDFDDG